MSTFWSNSSASMLIVSSGRVWVRVAISPRCISFLITSAAETFIDSATSLTVAPELIVVGASSF